MVAEPEMSKAASLLQTCYFQSTSLMQVDCQDVLLTSVMQVISITCSKSANIKVKKSTTHIKSVTFLVATCEFLAVYRSCCNKFKTSC